MRFANIRSLDLNLLLPAFLLLEERNVSTAAERYLLSQPAMSRSLQRLRRVFGDELLIRTSHGYELTMRGRSLLRDLEQELPRLEQMLAPDAFDPRAARDIFKIAATDYALAVFAPELLKRAGKSAPGVSFEFEAWETGSFADLEHGRHDAVLWINEAPAPLRYDTLYDEEFVCVQPASLPIEELTLDSYARREHIVVGMEEGRQVHVDKQLMNLGVHRRAAVTVPSFITAIAVAAEVPYLATVPRRLAELHRHDPRLRILQPPPELANYSYILAWHPRSQDDPRHRWLRSLAAQTGTALQTAVG